MNLKLILFNGLDNLPAYLDINLPEETLFHGQQTNIVDQLWSLSLSLKYVRIGVFVMCLVLLPVSFVVANVLWLIFECKGYLID